MRDPNNPAPAARRQQPTPPTETEPEQQQSAASGPGAAGAPLPNGAWIPTGDLYHRVRYLQERCEDLESRSGNLSAQGFDDCEALIIEMLEQGADAAVERGSRERNIEKRVEEAVRAMVLRNAALAIRLGQHRRQAVAEGGS